MFAIRRVRLLRLITLAALTASALLTYDHFHPERAFCPLEQACHAAAASAAGSIMGIPTSIAGLIAFGAVFLLTLLPIEVARPLLRPAGSVAIVTGVFLLLFQVRILQAVCPFCLVADCGGIVAGLLTVTWPRPPIHRSGRFLRVEPGRARLAWSGVASLAVVVPFLWPRSAEPAWVEAPRTEASKAFLSAPAPFPVQPRAARAVLPMAPTSPGKAVAADADASAEPRAPGGPVLSTPSPRAVADLPRPPSESAPTAPSPSDVVVIEYLNPFCTHCRATHQRLDAVTATFPAPIRKFRVLTWTGDRFPLWARALALAEPLGLEERLFSELLKARSTSPSEVYAACARAGIDPQVVRRCAADSTPPARLVRDRELALSASLRGLPTLDIGRRRLMGEQSEADLRDALLAAAQR